MGINYFSLVVYFQLRKHEPSIIYDDFWLEMKLTSLFPGYFRSLLQVTDTPVFQRGVMDSRREQSSPLFWLED